jgi:PPOX class probable F420-dependent enzyme
MATPLDSQRYINLETFKKDGGAVQTPVWAAPLDGKLVVVTDGTSYKVKRLRRNPRIRAAACDVRGKLKGEWHEGSGRVIEDPGQRDRALAALRQKYGWQIGVLNFFARLSGRMQRRAYLELEVKA